MIAVILIVTEIPLQLRAGYMHVCKSANAVSSARKAKAIVYPAKTDSSCKAEA